MSKKMWGGRFAKKTNKLVEEFTKSIAYDYRLAECDIVGSLIHINVLKKSGFLTSAEYTKLKVALESINTKLKKNLVKFDSDSEDIHTAVQNILEKSIGKLSLKLHTARSRNDQVLFDLKLFCKLELFNTMILVEKLRISFEKVAKKNKSLIIPGYTHLQQAQLVYLSDYFESYREMLKRDMKRLLNVAKSIDLSLGSGAISGTPINAKLYKAAIKEYFSKDKDLKGFISSDVISSGKALDTVSNRDFVIETLSTLSIIGMHLSRFAEDIIIWSTKEFDFVTLDDSFATGSSLMPQKKNPDVLELVRGYTGTLYGNLISVLTTMKGLPLSYNRDMQLDKPGLFSSLDIIKSELEVLPDLIESLSWNKKVIKERIENDEAFYATDILYHLVKKGIPFLNAHELVGKLVKYSGDTGQKIKDMNDKTLSKISGKLKHNEIVKIMNPETSVKSRTSIER